MSLSSLQLVVACALVAAWAGLLGRPIISGFLQRSGRPLSADGSRRLGWTDRPRPVGAWRLQPIEKRRLQLTLGFGLATFAALLLAIALRGEFVTLFLMMVGFTALHLTVAAYIGSVELRSQEAQTRARREAGTHRSDETFVLGRPESSVLEPMTPSEPLADDRLYDDAFFEPIPELVFEPLDLEANRTTVRPEEEVAELVEQAVAGDDAALDEPGPAEPVADPGFKTPPQARPGGARRTNKPPPIYRGPEAGDGDGEARAVND